MSERKIVILAIVTMFLWGSLIPAVKLAYSLYQLYSIADILLFAGIRFSICGAVICVFSFLRKKENFLPVKKSLLLVLLSGVFAVILRYGFTYIGLQTVESSKAGILKQAGILFYVVFSALFFRDDRLTVRKFLGVILGLAGIVAINFSPKGFSFRSGDVLVICASFCTVFSNVISKTVFRKVEPITATGCSQLFGGSVLLIVGAAMGGSMHFRWNISILLTAYICAASVISYCIWFSIVKEGELSRLFIIKFAEPIFSAVFGAILLSENILKIEYLIAFMLVCAGICISNGGKRQKPEARNKTRHIEMRDTTLPQ